MATLSSDQRKKVLQLIKDHIKEQHNCSVGWAITQIAGEGFGRSQHNREKIAAAITESGEYVKGVSNEVQGDWNIFKNPQYRLTKFNIWTVVINTIIALLSVLAAIYSIIKCKC